MVRMAEAKQDGQPVRTLPWWVKWLVAFHVFSITIWSLPPPAPSIVNGSLKPAINFDGISPFARSLVPYIHDRILLFAYKVKYPSHDASPPTRVVGGAMRAYLLPTGMWQYWDMFAPNPSNLDVWVDAEVVFQDGTAKVHAYPRMAKLSIPMKYVQERFRKFLERAHAENYQYAWPTFAQRIALSEFEDPANPPVSVTLRRHFREVQPPGQPTPATYREYLYFTHTVDLKALRRDKGLE